MAIPRYHRCELRLVLQRREDGALARVEVGRERREHLFAPEVVAGWVVARWLTGAGPTADELSEALGLEAAFASLAALESEARLGGETGARRIFRRVVLDIRDARLVPLDWETPLRREGIPVVRVSSVRPRVERIPLTLPLRFINVDPRFLESRALPGGWDRPIVGAQCTPDAFARFRSTGGWRTADVLHFLSGVTFRKDEAGLLSMAHPDEPGTLGWLVRLTDSWQTRLVVIANVGQDELGLLRRLAGSLVDRGGPAVLLSPSPARSWAPHVDRALMHDLPLDVRWEEPGTSLFVGAGREELLRVSALAEQLARPEVAQELLERMGNRSRFGLPGALERIRKLVDGWGDGQDASPWLLRMYQALRFLLQPEEATASPNIPAPATAPQSTKPGDSSKSSAAPVAGPSPLESFVGEDYVLASEDDLSASVPPSRHVNAFLHEEGADGRPRRLEPRTTRLTPGEVVHLSVQLGPYDELAPAMGPTALLEEQLHWTVGTQGTFLEVGVTGMDFDVLGDPVQELWLPRSGPSDAVFFALVPRGDSRIEGVARLRLCLYQNGNLLQSFRLAALLRRPGEESLETAERARRLAEALEVDVVQMLELFRTWDVGYLSRLEYGSGVAPEALPELPPRALSLTVNRSANQEVVTVKGQDLFDVHVGGNLAEVVQRLREVLATSAEDAAGNYRFVHQGQLNQGEPGHFDTVMRELARHGWDLFVQLVPSYAAQERVRAILEGDSRVIHAAHVHLENVIPWALVYDRFYDADNQSDTHGTCLAALPGPDGTPGARKCGEHPSCPLHPSRKAEGYTEETVVCPRHFWGFQHIVEVPAQQVTRLGDTPPERAHVVTCSTPVKLVLGQHAGLQLAGRHLEQLQETLQAAPLPAVLAPAADRDSLLKSLKVNPPPDIVYLYCHARAGSRLDGNPREPKEPHLELGPPGKPGWITASQVAGPEWPHRPLIFLNGCGTAAFDSTKPAQLILNLGARGAGGVIGTEVTIWEALATEMGLRFLTGFLGQRPAGEALLEARRALLGKYNPLGFVYTLYGPAELRLAPASVPKKEPGPTPPS